MGFSLMLALLLFKLCDNTLAIIVTNAIPISTEIHKNYDQQLLTPTQPISQFNDITITDDDITQLLSHKSNQLNDLHNSAAINRSKRNSKGPDRSFIRLGRLDIDNNRQMNFHDRFPSKPDKSFIRFGRSEPPSSASSVKNTGFIRFGRSNNNKGFIRLGRNDDRSDIMRFGRRGDKFIRFGRNDGGINSKIQSNSNVDDGTDVTPDQETFAARAGGDNDDFFKILRPVPRIGRNDKFIRFGRRDQGFIRFGKKSDDNRNLSKTNDQSENQSLETLKSETKEIIGDQITHPMHVSDFEEEKPFQLLKNDKDYYDHYYQTNLINEDNDQFENDNTDPI